MQVPHQKWVERSKVPHIQNEQEVLSKVINKIKEQRSIHGLSTLFKILSQARQ